MKQQSIPIIDHETKIGLKPETPSGVPEALTAA